MAARTTLDAAALRQAVAGYRDALKDHRAAINRLNVYPVPDGDTGTNMALTIESVLEEVEAADDDMGATCKAISHGSLMGARGNSGVILSQMLRGLCGHIADLDAVDGAAFAAGLQSASSSADGAVERPVDGTILTVLRESADAAADAADRGCDLLTVVEAARRRAGEALDRTPAQLPVLAEAGVVDAGGAGFVLLLDAVLHVVDGRPVPTAVEGEGIVDPERAAHLPQGSGHAPDVHGSGNISELRYEVMYLLEAPDEAVPDFKEVWTGLGDSIVVAGGDGLWNCHIHTDDIGGAVEAALDCGRPRNIRVTDLLEQVEEERWVREGQAAAGPDPDLGPVPTAVVAVATGDGIGRIFRSLRVHHVITGGQTMNPSTKELLDAVEAVPADDVVVLPNNKNIIPVAEHVDEQTAKSVVVVPTRSITEGFAALTAYDPVSTAADNAKAMRAAAADVVGGEVTRAVRDSSCDLGPIHEGDWLGIGPDGIGAVSDSIADAACDLLAGLVTEDHEIVTVIEGVGATAAHTRRITEWLADHRPDAEAEVHHGGQPLYPYLFGIE